MYPEERTQRKDAGDGNTEQSGHKENKMKRGTSHLGNGKSSGPQ